MLPSRTFLLRCIALAQLFIPATLFGVMFVNVVSTAGAFSSRVLASASSTILEAFAMSIPMVPASFVTSALIGLPLARLCARSGLRFGAILWLSLLLAHIAAATAVASAAWAISGRNWFGALVAYAALVGLIVASAATWLAAVRART